jgi:hypothetical protein
VGGLPIPMTYLAGGAAVLLVVAMLVLFRPGSSPSPGPAPTAEAQPASAPTAAAAPTATAISTVAPTATAVPATPTPRPAATPEPNGAIPSGWKVYRGVREPFVIVYPPDWTVDESRAGSGAVYFVAPDPSIWVGIITTGTDAGGASAETLRDADFKSFVETYPDTQLIQTGWPDRVSGIPFSGYSVAYHEDGVEHFSNIAVGLNEGVPWFYRISAPRSQFDATLNSVFRPMIASLNIYANP